MGFRRLWQWLSADMPWAISNWLWASIVNPLVAGVMQLTLRRIVHLAFFIVCAWAAAEYFAADVAVMLAGDMALYLEIATFSYIALTRARIHRALVPAVQMLRTAVQRRAQTCVRIAIRAKRPLRLPRFFGDEDSDDVPDGAFVLAWR